MVKSNNVQHTDSWFRRCKNRFAPRLHRARHRDASQRRLAATELAVESLEDRHLLAAGNVFLTGHDVLLHGGFNNFDSKVLNFMRGAGTPAEIPANQYSIAVLGSDQGGWSFSEGGKVKAGYETTNYFNTHDLERLPGRWDEVLAHDGLIVLSHESCGGCDLDDQGIREMNANATAILNAVDAGMDLWMNSSGDSVGYYDILSPITEIVPLNGHFEGDYTLTSAGIDLGFDESIDFVNHHNVFEPNDALTVVSVVNSLGQEHVVSAFLGRVKVEGQVWQDTNENGLRDPNETPIAGATIQLNDASGLVDVVQSDQSGRYSLFGTRPGTFHISVVPPEGASLSPMDSGDDRIDSDIDPISYRSADFDLSYNDLDQIVDVGFFGSGGTATIDATVWDDLNSDGLQDPTEPGLAGVDVSLLDTNGNVISNTVSANDGCIFGSCAW